MPTKPYLLVLRILIVLLLGVAFAVPQARPGMAPAAPDLQPANGSKPAQSGHEMTAADVGAFLDGFSAIGVLLVIIACRRSWSDRSVGAGAKVWNLLVLVACMGFVWFVLYWNLLDFRRNY